MNRFFRSALFPLIVIAALVWLAVQTLSGHGHKTTKASLSEVQNIIVAQPGTIKNADFNPNKRELALNLPGPSKVVGGGLHELEGLKSLGQPIPLGRATSRVADLKVAYPSSRDVAALGPRFDCLPD